jgi:signal peptidase
MRDADDRRKASIITPIQVSGGSMEPTLSPGDVCLVREGVTPKVGSIVLLKRPGDATETLHRVVAQSPRGLETQGDANPTRDRQALRSRDVQGTVVGVIPVGRWIGR